MQKDLRLQVHHKHDHQNMLKHSIFKFMIIRMNTITPADITPKRGEVSHERPEQHHAVSNKDLDPIQKPSCMEEHPHPLLRARERKLARPTYQMETLWPKGFAAKPVPFPCNGREIACKPTDTTTTEGQLHWLQTQGG